MNMISIMGSGVTPDPSITLPASSGASQTTYGYAAEGLFSLGNDKNIYTYTTTYDQFGPVDTLTDIGDWCTGTAASYDVRATVFEGALSTGTTGSWLNLGTTRSWSVIANSVGTSTCRMTLEIRNASTLRRVATGTATLTAQRVS